eukprot:TRINITY_DN13380_c0_g1_i5.p1 TRINITY_DN13380_c0_g1~~TRINITY_DN13380_c0_g1_i5.p1  ORF type:complete len:568 (+),score=67.84 TRINITY_DN13380_c0_g1_i5:79-1782(+)
MAGWSPAPALCGGSPFALRVAGSSASAPAAVVAAPCGAATLETARHHAPAGAAAGPSEAFRATLRAQQAALDLVRAENAVLQEQLAQARSRPLENHYRPLEGRPSAARGGAPSGAARRRVLELMSPPVASAPVLSGAPLLLPAQPPVPIGVSAPRSPVGPAASFPWAPAPFHVPPPPPMFLLQQQQPEQFDRKQRPPVPPPSSLPSPRPPSAPPPSPPASIPTRSPVRARSPSVVRFESPVGSPQRCADRPPPAPTAPAAHASGCRAAGGSPESTACGGSSAGARAAAGRPPPKQGAPPGQQQQQPARPRYVPPVRRPAEPAPRAALSAAHAAGPPAPPPPPAALRRPGAQRDPASSPADASLQSAPPQPAAAGLGPVSTASDGATDEVRVSPRSSETGVVPAPTAEPQPARPAGGERAPQPQAPPAPHPQPQHHTSASAAAANGGHEAGLRGWRRLVALAEGEVSEAELSLVSWDTVRALMDHYGMTSAVDRALVEVCWRVASGAAAPQPATEPSTQQTSLPSAPRSPGQRHADSPHPRPPWRGIRWQPPRQEAMLLHRFSGGSGM